MFNCTGYIKYLNLLSTRCRASTLLALGTNCNQRILEPALPLKQAHRIQGWLG